MREGRRSGRRERARRASRRARGRRLGGAAAALLIGLLAAGCASTQRRPDTTPTTPEDAAPVGGAAGEARRPPALLILAGVPAAPAGLAPTGQERWERLRERPGGSIAGLRDLPSPCEAPSDPGCLLAGFEALVAGRTGEAHGLLEPLTEQPELAAVALYGLGVAAHAEGDEAAAGRWLRQARDHDPLLAEASLALQALRLRRARRLLGSLGSGATGEEERILREIIDLLPDLMPPYLRLAARYRSTGEPGRAAELLGQARQRLRDRPELLEPLAAALDADQRPGEAMEVLECLVELVPGDAEAQEMMLAARRRHTAAVVTGGGATENGPDEPLTREDLAALLAAAVPDLESLGEADPGRTLTVDVDTNEKPHVWQVLSLGVMETLGGQHFMPELGVTRAMLAEALYRVLALAGADAVGSAPELGDVPFPHRQRRMIEVVVARGLLGLDRAGRFRPAEPVIGREAVAVVGRLGEIVVAGRAARRR